MRKTGEVHLFLSRWKHRFSCNFNVWKTIYVNFAFLPRRQAIRFPIFVYGKVKIFDHSGKIVIEDDQIKRGMIQLGVNTDTFSASRGSALISIAGQLVFKGTTSFSVDYTLSILGECIIGKYCFFGNNVKICCFGKMSIGRSCRIAFESQLFDTNFHYMRNVETGRIDRRDGIVVLGDYCWIGNRTTIAKGTQLPDFSLVSGNSLVNKSFLESDVKYPFLAGTPAKIISSMRVRIFDTLEEEIIDEFFKDNPDALYYSGEPGEQDEEEKLEQYFNKIL